jgi:hypothetical protein
MAAGAMALFTGTTLRAGGEKRALPDDHATLRTRQKPFSLRFYEEPGQSLNQK